MFVFKYFLLWLADQRANNIELFLLLNIRGYKQTLTPYIYKNEKKEEIFWTPGGAEFLTDFILKNSILGKLGEPDSSEEEWWFLFNTNHPFQENNPPISEKK